MENTAVLLIAFKYLNQNTFLLKQISGIIIMKHAPGVNHCFILKTMYKFIEVQISIVCPKSTVTLPIAFIKIHLRLRCSSEHDEWNFMRKHWQKYHCYNCSHSFSGKRTVFLSKEVGHGVPFCTQHFQLHFVWLTIIAYWLRFHSSLFPRVQ